MIYFPWFSALIVSFWFVILSHDSAVRKNLHENLRARLESDMCAFNNFIKAKDLLEKWWKARPLLYVSQSEYAQSLVHTMIDSYTVLMAHNDQLKPTVLEALRKLLNQPPPSHDPPAGEETRSVGLSFFILIF